jgi:hypothetical protein
VKPAARAGEVPATAWNGGPSEPAGRSHQRVGDGARRWMAAQSDTGDGSFPTESGL